MTGGFEGFVARRYLLTKKKTGFISIISVISIAGIGLGVAALIIVLSLMNGFTKELRTRLVGMDGHIWVTTPFDKGMDDYRLVMNMLSDMDGVVGVSPFCEYQSIAHDRGARHVATLMVRGIDPATVNDVSDVDEFIKMGSLDLGKDENGISGIVLGTYLAQTLMTLEIGDTVFVYGLGDAKSILNNPSATPPVYQFRVAGFFSSGYYDYDNTVAFVSIDEAQRILGLDETVQGIAVKLDDAFAAVKYTRDGGLIEQVLGGYPYYSQDWVEKNQILFSWMKLEKWASFIVLSLIVLVAAFNIVSTLIMMVMDKTREVGILKSMGATSSSIQRIFVYQGAFVGVFGTLFGSMLGFAACYIQDKYRLLSLPSDVYFVSAVPVDFQLSDFIAINVVALFLCWISSYYPAKRAAGLDPVQAIRDE